MLPIDRITDVPGIQFTRFHRVLTNDEYAAYVADDEERLLSAPDDNRIVVLIDAMNYLKGNAAQRKMSTEFHEAHEEALQRQVIAVVFIADSLIIRGALQAMQWFAPMPYPFEVAATIDKALVRTDAHLIKAGLAALLPEHKERILSLYA
mgnify:FL=1